MTTTTGNTRVIHFGKGNRVAVTFTQRGGLWHAHAALLPNPHRHLRVARQIVARRLAKIASDAAVAYTDQPEYRIAAVRENGDWDVVETFHAADHDAAREYAESEYGENDVFVLDHTGRNIDGGVDG